MRLILNFRFSYKNDKDVLDLNKKVDITENEFNISDNNTIAIRVAKDNAELSNNNPSNSFFIVFLLKFLFILLYFPYCIRILI